jgi:hypothetical protein
MDLLTVVLHEVGHVLGKEHADAPNLMVDDLSTGTRRVPAANIVADVNGDGKFTSRDVLEIVNVISAYGSLGNRALAALGVSFARLDINGDGFVSSADARLVVNKVNSAAEADARRREADRNAAGVVPTIAGANSANHLARTQHFAALADMALTQGPRSLPSLTTGHAADGNDEGLTTAGLEDDLLAMLADEWHRGV